MAWATCSGVMALPPNRIAQTPRQPPTRKLSFLDLSAETQKDQVNQIIVARKAVLIVLSEIDREISNRRAAIQERPDAMAGERRRGETL